LKGGSFVEAVRGKDGELTGGEIKRFMEGPLPPVECAAGGKKGACSVYGRRVFLSLWEKAEQALEEIYDGTTFHELVVQEINLNAECVPDFSI